MNQRRNDGGNLLPGYHDTWFTRAHQVAK